MSRPPGDNHRLFPRYRDVRLDSEVKQRPPAEKEAKLRARAEREFTHGAVDRVRLRGIPAVCGRDSIGGAIRSSRPDVAILNLDRRR